MNTFEKVIITACILLTAMDGVLMIGTTPLFSLVPQWLDTTLLALGSLALVWLAIKFWRSK